MICRKLRVKEASCLIQWIDFRSESETAYAFSLTINEDSDWSRGLAVSVAGS